MNDEILKRLRSVLKAYADLKATAPAGPKTGGGAADRKRRNCADALRNIVGPVLEIFADELRQTGHAAATRDHTEREDAYPSVGLSFTPQKGLASALMFKYDPRRGILVQREIKASPNKGRSVTAATDRIGTIGVDALTTQWVETKTLAFVVDVLKAN